jgi:integrase
LFARHIFFQLLLLYLPKGMRMSGADIHTVAQLLGHKDLRMAARYQHLSPAFLASAVSKLDAVFGGIASVGNDHPISTQKALTAAPN